MQSVHSKQQKIASFVHQNVVVAEPRRNSTPPSFVRSRLESDTQRTSIRSSRGVTLLCSGLLNRRRVERTMRILVSVQASALLLLVLLQAALFAVSCFLVRS